MEWIIFIIVLFGCICSIAYYCKNTWKLSILGLAIFFGILTLIMGIVIADKVYIENYSSNVSSLN